MKMRLPGFTAGAALYDLDCAYYVGRVGAFAGAAVLPQDVPGSGGPVFEETECAQALAICNGDALRYHWDAHGWCDWYERNCIFGGPPGGGSSGGGTPKKPPGPVHA